MRTLPLYFLLIILGVANRASGQPLSGGGFFTGIQLVNINTGKNARQPMMYIWEQQSLKLNRRLSVGGDITLVKNTVPYGRVQGKVLEFFRLNVPLHLDLRVVGNWFVEAGVYIGATTKSRNVYITEFVQVKYFEALEMRLDTGGMAGLSLRLKNWGKLHFRYNHGLFPAVPISGERIEKDRMATTGISISF